MKHCKGKRRIYHIFTIFLCITLGIATFVAIKDFGKVYNDSIHISSPDGRYTLVVKEWGTLGGTGADIYIESASAWWPFATRRKIGMTIADDCVYPFRDGYYQVSWESEYVVINYYSGRQQEDTSDIDSWAGYFEYTINR